MNGEDLAEARIGVDGLLSVLSIQQLLIAGAVLAGLLIESLQETLQVLNGEDLGQASLGVDMLLFSAL